MATYSVAGIGEHGKFFDENAYRDAINYITQHGQAPYYGGANVSSTENASTEMKETAVAFGKDSGKRLRHSVLSFSESEQITPEQANEFGQQIIQYYSPEYQIVYAVHNNTSHPHIHFVMNQISHLDGHRYAGKKKDYYDFQRYMKSVTHLPIRLVKDTDSSR